ncbi:MAG: cellulase family glycosylhydrolase [Mobilitalea sp.]
MSFVKVKGTSFSLDDKEILFSGLGIGTWMNMEHFMLGIPTTDKQIRKTFQEVYGEETASEFFEKFALDFITEEDFQFLKETGINLVRIPFNYHLFIDDQNPAEYREEGFRYFDRLMALSREYGIYLLPDLHTAPGGQNPDWHSDNQTGYTEFWHYKVFRDQITALWQAIAARYQDEPYLLGYDILNEPFMIPKEDQMDSFYKEVTKSIRQVDSNHILFLEGDYFAMDFSSIHTIEDPQTALTFHFYPTVWNTDLFKKDYDRSIRKAEFETIFAKLIQIREQFSVPILCGEAGYDIDKEDFGFTMGLVEDTLELFKKYKISWTLWCYKDAQFMGVVYPKTDSPWMKLNAIISQYWNQHKDTQMAQDAIRAICDTYFPEAKEEDIYHLRFSQRAVIYHLQAEYWLKPELKKYSKEEILKLPESFQFANCSYYQEYVDLLKRYTL